MIKREELSNVNSCLNRAKDDELVFVLLGRDACAPAAIRTWAAERVRVGKNTWGDAQIIDALACIAEMSKPHALSLSSPIEPPTLTQERAKMIAASLVRDCTAGWKRTREEIIDEIASTLLTVDAAARPAQASSEVREALTAEQLQAEWYAVHESTGMNYLTTAGPKWFAAYAERINALLAPSRQGAGRK